MYNSLIDSKPLHIRLDKMDRFIRVYDGTKYLVLLGNKKYHSIYYKIWYLMSVKSGISYIIFHNYAIIKVDSYNSLPPNVVILVKSVWNKDKSNYYYNMFLEKASYELPKK